MRVDVVPTHAYRARFHVATTDDDTAVAVGVPRIACLRSDVGPFVRRVVNWASNISLGKADFRQTKTPATFVPGGSNAPASRLPDQ